MPNTLELSRRIIDPFFQRRLEQNQIPIPTRVDDLLQGKTYDEFADLDHVMVLGTSMDQNPTSGEWLFPTIVQSDGGRLVGGHWRLDAVGIIWEKGFKGKFAITGGCQEDAQGNSVSKAQVFADRLLQQQPQIPKENVVIIGTEGKGNTLGNIENIQNYLSDQDEIDGSRIGIVSGWWQAPRAHLLFEANSFFKERELDLVPIVAEDLVAKNIPDIDFAKLPEKQKAVLLALDREVDLNAADERVFIENRGIKNYFIDRSYKPERS